MTRLLLNFLVVALLAGCGKKDTGVYGAWSLNQDGTYTTIVEHGAVMRQTPAPHKKSSDEAFAELMIQPCSAVMKTGTIAFAMTVEQSVEWGHKLDTCVQESSR